MLKFISDVIWGPATPIIFAAVGLLFIIRLRFFSPKNVKYILKNTLFSMLRPQKSSGLSPFSAMATALGGTIGVGNTVGVASAVICGGMGAALWMIIASFFGMAIKYAEIYLAVRYKDSHGGGAVYYIEKGLKSPLLAFIFGVVCVGASLGMGNMAQSDAASRYMKLSFDVEPLFCGICIALVTLYLICGGIKRIGRVSAVTVPIMAVFYMAMCVIIIAVNYKGIPSAVTEIISSAFDFSSVSGGIGGFFVSRAVRYGFSRGLFSNEAGMGSSPTAHAASDQTIPQRQAVWGVFEVFCDTVAVCGLTALAIATSEVCTTENPSELIYNVFTSVFGNAGGILLSLSIVFFALASIMCWYVYGSEALKYLSKSPIILWLYRILFCTAVLLGTVCGTESVWLMSDILNGIMAFINLSALVLLCDEVKPPCE